MPLDMSRTTFSLIGLISDIHGNAVALRAVPDELDRIGVTEIICLGDVAGYGPQINECGDILIKRNITCLMGNHDYYIVENEPCPRSTIANICLDYQRSVITTAHKEWLARGLLRLEKNPGISLVHGGWNAPLDEYLYELRASYFSKLKGTLFISGHTHVQGIWQVGNGKIYCNPGSVGQPRDGNPLAAFAVLNGIDVKLFRIPYDIDEIAKCSLEAGYEKRAFMNLYKGTRIGGTVVRVWVISDDNTDID